MPVVLVLLAAGLGFWWWKSHQQPAAPQPSLPPPEEEGPTPGTIPTSDVPTYMIRFEKRPNNEAEAVSDDFHVIHDPELTGSNQTVIIYAAHLPIDVLVSAPASFSPPTRVKVNGTNEMLSEEGTRDVLIRVNEFTDIPSLATVPKESDKEQASFVVSADYTTGHAGNLSGLHLPIYFYVNQLNG